MQNLFEILGDQQTNPRAFLFQDDVGGYGGSVQERRYICRIQGIFSDNFLDADKYADGLVFGGRRRF